MRFEHRDGGAAMEIPSAVHEEAVQEGNRKRRDLGLGHRAQGLASRLTAQKCRSGDVRRVTEAER
jgi:hypothetical protein